MKTLEMSFKSADTRIKYLRLKYVNETLSAEDVQETMLKMAAAKLFAKGDVALYDQPVAANIVETTKTPFPAAETVPAA